MSDYAPKREDGMCAYVVRKTSWGRTWDRIEWAPTLTAAKREFGWKREQHTSVSVRRATSGDLERGDSR